MGVLPVLGSLGPNAFTNNSTPDICSLVYGQLALSIPCSMGYRVHIHIRSCFCCFLLLERTCSIIRGRRAEALHSPWLPPCKLHLIIMLWLLRNLGVPRPPHCQLEGAGSDFCFVLSRWRPSWNYQHPVYFSSKI